MKDEDGDEEDGYVTGLYNIVLAVKVETRNVLICKFLAFINRIQI